MTDNALEHKKIKEQWLREELRATRSLMNNTVQWGITVLAAAELTLRFLRAEIHQHFVVRHPEDAERFSLHHWVIGTVLMMILSAVFFIIMRRHRQRFQHHRRQLSQMDGGYSSISEELSGGKILIYIVPEMLFLTMPLFDISLWIVLYPSSFWSLIEQLRTWGLIMSH